MFCRIVCGKEPAKVVLDLEDFLAIENKFPKAPIHILVIDKKHRVKADTMSGKYSEEHYWGKLFKAINSVLKRMKLDETGYEIIYNGAGYNHYEHEHVHVLGGYKEKEPRL